MKLWHNQNQEYEKNGILMPDIFRGQVLSLHPLSSIVMTDPVHFSVIGKLIHHEKFSELHTSNITDDFSEYWDFVATVVVAAKEYQLSHERWKQSRSRVQYTDQARVENASIAESPYCVELAFEDYASCHSICCESCGGVLQFQSHTENEGTDDVEVLFKCRNCQNPQNIQIDHQLMSEMLLTKDGD